MAVTSGVYTAAYNSNNVGYTQEGFFWEMVSNRKPVTTETYGDTEVDGVQRGGQCFLEFILQEYNAAATASILWPHGSTLGEIDKVGHLEVGSSLALAMVLTATAGTPSASNFVASITFQKSILEAEFVRRLNMNNNDLFIPIRMRNYPSTVSTDFRFFSVT